jgi:hypothetical protein
VTSAYTNAEPKARSHRPLRRFSLGNARLGRLASQACRNLGSISGPRARPRSATLVIALSISASLGRGMRFSSATPAYPMGCPDHKEVSLRTLAR